MKIVYIDLERCFGCGHCTWICAFQRTADFRPENAHIWVEVNLETRSIFTSTCLQCETAPCLTVCLKKALTRDPHTHAVVVAENLCMGCKLCIVACPFGNIHFDDQRGVAAKCNLCQGDPQCVKFCMAKALQYGDINELAARKRTSAEWKLARGSAVRGEEPA